MAIIPPLADGDNQQTSAVDTFYTITEAVGGDMVLAFLFCMRMEGQIITVPTKKHKHVMAKEMLQHGYNKNIVMETTGVSKATLYRILNEMAGGKDGKKEKNKR